LSSNEPSHTRRRRLGAALAFAPALLALAGTASAVSPKYWIHDSSEEFAKGEPDGVSVLADGSLRLAPALERLAEIDEPYLWDVAVETKSKVIYAGTGDEGRVYKVDGKKAELFFQSAGLEVFSLAVDGKGRVFAGAAPEGLIYRIERSGEGTVLHDLSESYPWDLEIGPDGKLYAAIGSPGAVMRIDVESGKAEKIFETEDNHVVCLSFDDAGNLILGTEGRGLIVRLTPSGEARVLFDCPQGEVSAVLAGKNGEVWAAAAVPAEVRETTEPQSNADGTGLSMPFEITATIPGDAVLYHIDSSGNTRRAWESGQAAIYDLGFSKDGHVLAVTGEEAGVYEITDGGRATLLFSAEEEQVVGIAHESSNDAVVVTANPSRVYQSKSALRGEGEYVSEVLDARSMARWGRIEWDGEENGGSVKLSVRSGNTDAPDKTWTKWEGNLDGNGGNLSFVEPSRFLQWKIKLSGGGKSTPVVRRVRVSSLENNLAPRIAKVQVVPSGNRFYEDVPELRPRTLHQQLEGGVKIQYSFEGGAEEAFPPESRAPWTQGMRQILWEAGDPNEDALVFDLEYRQEDETRWKMFAEDVDGKNFSFDSRGIPDGSYRIRVTASDRRDNPDNERTDMRESEVFIVDNTAPYFAEAKHHKNGKKVVVAGRLEDATSDVVRIESSVNGGEWINVSPNDGIFDSRTEEFKFELDIDPAEENAIVLRGTDLPGNLGTARVLVRP
jgi:streptogramin lyase